MKKKKGFTLVELLAVIVILAIILVIAVPQILKTINSSRLSAFKSSAQLLIDQATKQYMIDQTEVADASGDLAVVKYGGIGTASSGADRPCTFLTELSQNDYATCEITVSNEGVATLTEFTGKGKFKGYSCTGTKDNVTCTGEGNGSSGSGSNSNTTQYVYSFGKITSADDPKAKANWQDVGKTVFLKYNVNDFDEAYVCTTYNIGSGEPVCIGESAFKQYKEADEDEKPNTEWYKIIEKFGVENCDANDSGVSCFVYLNNNTYDNYASCSAYENMDYSNCEWIDDVVGYISCYASDAPNQACGQG